MKNVAVIVTLVSVLASAACSENPQEHLTRATSYLEQKKYNEAIVELRTALQIDPRLAGARLKLADAYLAMQKPGEALKEVIRAADLLPDDKAVQLRAANMLLLARSYTDAKTRAERVIALDPQNAEAHVVVGNALAGLTEHDNALAQYEQALQADATSIEPYLGIGAVQASRGQNKEAEESFRRAVALDPKNARPKFALANFYVGTRQFEQGEATFMDILSVEPDNLAANRAMSVLLLASGKRAEAEQYFVAVAKLSPDRNATAALAQYYVLTGRKADARTVLTRLAERPDAYANATVRLAYLDLADGDRTAAWRRTKEILSKFPKDVGALVLSSNLFLGERKYGEALGAATSALAVDPSSARAHEAAGRVHMTTDRRTDAIRSFEEALRSDQDSYFAAISLARLHLEQQELDKSITFAGRALALRPDSADAQSIIARNHLARGDVSQAKPLVEQLRQRAPNAAFSHDLTAALQLASRQPDAARASYERALKLDPRDLDAVTGLVTLDYAAGRKAEAAIRAEALLAARRRDEASLLLAGRTYAALGDAKRAETSYKEALALNPNRLSTYSLLGELYARFNRLDDAVKQFEQLRGRDQKSIAASTMLGLIHEHRGDKAAAEREYKRTLAINSRAAVAANNLAWLYVSSNRQLEEALQLAQVAHEEIPDEPNISDTLGWIYVQKKLEKLAIPLLEASAKRMPQNPIAHYHLGMAYLQAATDMFKAKESLQRALTLSRSFEGADEARRALQSLGN